MNEQDVKTVNETIKCEIPKGIVKELEILDHCINSVSRHHQVHNSILAGFQTRIELLENKVNKLKRYINISWASAILGVIFILALNVLRIFL